MIRKAEQTDIPDIVAFLEAHIETSMFLLGNLETYGLENRTHPYGTSYFLRETGDGITGVFGATNGGLLMCQLPGIGATEAQTYAHLLQGYTLRGMTGEAAQVQTILDALSIEEEAWRINRVQPLYAMDLAGLQENDAEICAPEEGDREGLAVWFTHLAEDNPFADGTVESNVNAAIETGNVRFLLDDGMPVAMTGINARAADAVQVGGVFVPRELRGKGFAGKVVAAHLAQLRDEGIARAILFVASDAAARAYEKIGFTREGTYRIALLNGPLTLGSQR